VLTQHPGLPGVGAVGLLFGIGCNVPSSVYVDGLSLVYVTCHVVVSLLGQSRQPVALLQLSCFVPCSQDFLNNVCTNIIHMHKKQLQYYSGNYDQYVQTRAELEENQMKRYKWEQEQISHMKVSCGCTRQLCKHC